MYPEENQKKRKSCTLRQSCSPDLSMDRDENEETKLEDCLSTDNFFMLA